jgi:hypothetical protein
MESLADLGRDLRVEWVDFYGDHTMTIVIGDSTGQRAWFCIDGRANSPTRYRLFQNGRHPRKEGAVLVELGAPEEGTVVPLVSRFLEAGPKATELTEFGWELARETLLRLGEPQVKEGTNC